MPLNAELSKERIAAAAVWFQLYAAAYAGLVVWLPPADAQLRASDPLIQLLWPMGGPWGTLGVCAAFSLPWVVLRPGVRHLAEALAYAIAGALVAGATVGSLYWLGGGAFPAFVPPEESSATGLTLGVGAGALEEAVFRFGVLPGSFFLLRKRLPAVAAMSAASLVTGLAFALSHELGAGAGPFQLAYFTTRVVIPGAAMSLVFLVVHPAFLVSAHCAAHLGINLVFHAR